jgi:hypothetical protein
MRAILSPLYALIFVFRAYNTKRRLGYIYIQFYNQLSATNNDKSFEKQTKEGLNSIETALAYVEQQREATATDVLLFRRWRGLAAKKRKEAQKQIPITNFLKNKLFRLQIYIL